MPKEISLDAGEVSNQLASIAGEMHLTPSKASADLRLHTIKSEPRWVRASASETSPQGRTVGRPAPTGAPCGPGTPKDLADVSDAPFWLRIVARELLEAIDDPDEAAQFASDVRRLSASGGDAVALEWRFTLARLIGPVCGLVAPVSEMTGKAGAYAAALQRLIQALNEGLAAGPEAAAAELEIREAYCALAGVAPDPDASLLKTGAPMSFFAVWASGAWREKRREALGASNRADAWADSRAAARDDLIAALSFH